MKMTPNLYVDNLHIKSQESETLKDNKNNIALKSQLHSSTLCKIKTW